VSFYVLFVCKCVLYNCHRVATQLQLTNISISISIRQPKSEATYHHLLPIIKYVGYTSTSPYALKVYQKATLFKLWDHNHLGSWLCCMLFSCKFFLILPPGGSVIYHNTHLENPETLSPLASNFFIAQSHTGYCGLVHGPYIATNKWYT
jgi:hypothetical protein